MVSQPNVFAAATLSQQERNMIALSCKYYLNQYHSLADMPAKEAKQAAPALKRCYEHNSCLNTHLLGIPNCTRKLTNWHIDYTTPPISSLKTAAPKVTVKTPVPTNTDKTQTFAPIPLTPKNTSCNNSNTQTIEYRKKGITTQKRKTTQNQLVLNKRLTHHENKENMH